MIIKVVRYILIILIILLFSYSIFNLYKSYKLQYESFDTIDKIIKREDFDCYIINLKKNTERLGVINELYNKSDLSSIPYIRVEAINGKEIDVTDKNNWCLKNNVLFLKLGILSGYREIYFMIANSSNMINKEEEIYEIIKDTLLYFDYNIDW